MKKKCLLACLLLCIASIALPAVTYASNASGSSVQQAEGLRGKEVAIYESVDGRFRRIGTLPVTAFHMPQPVLAASSRGYVQLRAADGDVWLDKLSVKINLSLAPGSRCLDTVTSRSDASIKGVAGAGEGCR